MSTGEYITNQQLKINKKLPQIILPQNKIDMFLDWYNEDLRHQDTLPKAFNEGYIIIDNDVMNIDVSKCGDYLKRMAKQLNTTYRMMENRLIYYTSCLNKVTVYFKFTDDVYYLEVYGSDDSKVSNISLQFKEGSNSEFTNRHITEIDTNWDTTLNKFNEFCLIMVYTAMWYISTTTKTTKYYYEHKEPVVYKKKDVIKVSRDKTISTPIYDMTKIKRVKVDHLIKRRKGWTYSHSFQVHGHYRHYKDGKTIFVNSYIKGKNKELQPQVITLDPKG